MSDKLEVARKEIKQTIFPIFLGIALSFILGLSEIYKLFSQNNFSGNQALGAFLSFLSGLLFLFVPFLLRKENKHALTLTLIGLGLGLTRWIAIDKTFELNITTIILLSLFAWYVLRFTKWIKVGALR